MRLLSFCAAFLRLRAAACLHQGGHLATESHPHPHPQSSTPSHQYPYVGRGGAGAGGGGSWSSGLLAIDFDAVVSNHTHPFL